MDKMEFRRMFCDKEVYNDNDWNENAGYQVLSDVCSFWNGMRKAGALPDGLNEEFCAQAKNCGVTMDARPLIDLVENVLLRYGCVLAQNRATYAQTVVEQELLDPDITDLLWESREYNCPED